MASVKIKETMEDWYSVERDFIAVITDLTKQVSTKYHGIRAMHLKINLQYGFFFTEGRAIRQCSSLMVENQPKCSLYASTQQCNCNTDECNVDQNCACNKGQGSIVMSFLPLIIQPMIVTFF